jgi:hypothetical protein
MKTLRHVLLSVLLSAFGFLSVHDYVIAGVDDNTRYGICHFQEKSATPDLPKQIHKHIHALLSAPQMQTALFENIVADIQHFSTPERPISHISSVWPKPPLT